MRGKFLYLLLSILFSTPVLAGDFALEQAIGFSKDGRYFGFEEYGIQDGSGFPYSHIFIIDLETDTFAPSTPVRVRIDRDSASLQDARLRARKNAQSVLRKYKLTNPARVIHARGLGDFAGFEGGLSTPITTKVALPSFSDPTQAARKTFDLILKHIPAPSVSKCPLDTIGFQMEKIRTDGTRRFIHRDEKILKSRGCPLKYRISRIYTPMVGQGDFLAVLISVFQTGFEGADRRFIVFPVSLN